MKRKKKLVPGQNVFHEHYIMKYRFLYDIWPWYESLLVYACVIIIAQPQMIIVHACVIIISHLGKLFGKMYYVHMDPQKSLHKCCGLNDFFTLGYERLPDLWDLS